MDNKERKNLQEALSDDDLDQVVGGTGVFSPKLFLRSGDNPFADVARNPEQCYSVVDRDHA